MDVNKQRKGILPTEWFIISKKTIWKAIGAVVMLIVLACVGYGVRQYYLRTENPKEEQRAIRFLRVEGRVSVKHNNSGAFGAAASDTPLEPGDTIQTGSDGTALIEYEDRSRYTIKPGSTIILKEKSEKRIVNDLQEGKLNVTTPENSIKHIVNAPGGISSTISSNTDARIDSSEGKVSVVVGKGLASILTPAGEEKIGTNQRLDVNDKGAVKSDLLPAPLVSAPENAKQIIIEANGDVDFAWKPVPGAVKYHISISPTQGFDRTLTLDTDTGSRDTKYKWIKPISGNFFWRVQGITKDEKDGAWSEIANFSVKVKATTNGTGSGFVLKLTKKIEISTLLYEIEGITKPGVNLTINEKPVEVDGKGFFKADITLPPNTPERQIKLRAVDANGTEQIFVEKLPYVPQY